MKKFVKAVILHRQTIERLAVFYIYVKPNNHNENKNSCFGIILIDKIDKSK